MMFEMFKIFMLFLFIVSVQALPTKRAGKDRNYEQNEFQINQGLCPPVLPMCSGPSQGVALDPAQDVSPFHEGDIVLDQPLRASIKSRRRKKKRHSQHRSRSRRSIARPISRLWKYGYVPYDFDSSVDDSTRHLIEKALQEIMKKTCIHFERRKSNDKDFILYVNQPGCWSYVGKKGGMQHLSIGRGCERKGTIMHETGHALGFWHEQSRPDRDKYVSVVKKNLSPRTLDQFKKLDNDDSSSRGFAYDYESLMHYGKSYFSINGKHTLRVKGIGKRMKLKIGQRKEFSDIDLAQLREMYYCNDRDKKERYEKLVCDSSNWHLHNGRCYRFNDIPENFGGANKICYRSNADLLHINNEEEDTFIKEYLIKNLKQHKVWRTGGRKLDGRFVWYNSNHKDHNRMKYKVWAPNHPKNKTSLSLQLYEQGQPQRFVWRAIPAGSKAELPMHVYPFICEKAAHKQGNKCHRLDKSLKGRDYRGKLDYTSQNITCMKWTSQYPHQHDTLTDKKVNTHDQTVNGLGDHNFCRNPNSEKDRPWCYVPLKKERWQYCDIDICD